MPSPMQMQSISGIITQVRVTSGEIPPPLVGASVTAVGDRVFVFAGRLVTTRKMTNHLYVLDVNTMIWTRHIPPPDSDKPPKPRYFHSATLHSPTNTIVMFGGMGHSRASTEGLCVLDDMSLFDLSTMTWKKPNIKPSLFAPRPRYAHLSCITEDDKLVIIGGQDMNNNYLGEINVLDLASWEWIQVKTLEKNVGTYRSIAITMPPDARLPTILSASSATAALETAEKDSVASSSVATDVNNRLARHPIGNGWGDDYQQQNPIYLYTNHNFADVKRELEIIFSPSSSSSVVEDCSSFMTGSAMPPGLRFPVGETLGHHLVLAGTYLSPQNQAFTIWSLNLGTLAWSRIETGNVFTSGSWNRSVLHAGSNRLFVFGNRDRNLLEDYNHRQVNFDHIASVDLEVFGVYRLPQSTCSPLAQEMGLSMLNEPAVSDFSIITRENQTIAVNSAVLCQRWPYFAELMKTANQEQPAAPTPAAGAGGETKTENGSESRRLIKSHSMIFPYSHAVVVALLQFIYTDSLLTAQQYQPHVLSQLLLLADMYNLSRLRELTIHALHQMLNMSTAPLIFETAALSHQTSLQIRALKMMIAAKKIIQQQQQPSSQQLTPRLGPSTATATSESCISTSSSGARQAVNSSTMAKALSGYNEPQGGSGSNNSTTTSPTLSAYHRTRTPSLTSRSMAHTSPPGTPKPGAAGLPQHHMYSPDNDVHPYQAATPASTTKSKEKQKKKPFLGAFGSKFTMSFQ
ncbi:hypothetical protein BX666DRAFT_2009875 [Dichotomocladium elegans]|nr:hypothetical protein BX666DRAFT_2009875 [Dichotomocladium elegans]